MKYRISKYVLTNVHLIAVLWLSMWKIEQTVTKLVDVI